MNSFFHEHAYPKMVTDALNHELDTQQIHCKWMLYKILITTFHPKMKLYGISDIVKP